MIPVIYSLFFFFAVVSALLVVFTRNAVYSALYLVVTMVAIAGIFLLINAQLAAALQIVVYAGAIMVLFLFVIMLLNLQTPDVLPAVTAPLRRAGAALVGTLLLQLVILAARLGGAPLFAAGPDVKTATLPQVAINLLTHYLYAFEMASILILVAVVGAMALARKSVMRASAPETNAQRWGKG